MTVLVGPAFGFQPEMVPLVVANRKTLAVESLFGTRSKVPGPPLLKTSPVGAPCSDGILTTNEESTETCVCDVLYRVLVPAPSLANHHSPLGLAASPQGLTVFVS